LSFSVPSVLRISMPSIENAAFASLLPVAASSVTRLRFLIPVVSPVIDVPLISAMYLRLDSSRTEMPIFWLVLSSSSPRLAASFTAAASDHPPTAAAMAGPNDFRAARMVLPALCVSFASEDESPRISMNALPILGASVIVYPPKWLRMSARRASNDSSGCTTVSPAIIDWICRNTSSRSCVSVMYGRHVIFAISIISMPSSFSACRLNRWNSPGVKARICGSVHPYIRAMSAIASSSPISFFRAAPPSRRGSRP